MKTCKDCKITKPLSEFHKNSNSKTTGKVWYRGRCRKCHNFRFRPTTGKPRGVKKGNVPWNKKVERGRRSLAANEWMIKIFERDGYKCQECSSDDKLNAHHIKSWNDYPEIRFDLDNGKTLCHSCHSKLHRSIDGFPNNRIPWNKGMNGYLKGRVSVMKGKTHTKESKIKMREAQLRRWALKRQKKIEGQLSIEA